jgi:hypothetical protein
VTLENNNFFQDNNLDLFLKRKKRSLVDFIKERQQSAIYLANSCNP